MVVWRPSRTPQGCSLQLQRLLTQREILMSPKSSIIVRRAIVAGRISIAAGALLAVLAFANTEIAAQALAVTPSTDSTLLALPSAPDAATSGDSTSVAVASVSTRVLSASAVTSNASVVFVSPTQKHIQPGQMRPR